MEIAHWHESWTAVVSSVADRVYLGHESCADRIPSGRRLKDGLARLREAGKKITLVTPFLFESDFKRVAGAVEATSTGPNPLEVVCNDWGLLHWLAVCRAAEPVLGRLLAGQATDPRFAAFSSPEEQRPWERFVAHADGVAVSLRYRPPPDALAEHLRGCAACIPEVLAFLREMGVRRFEVSHPLQGLRLAPEPGWSVTLHLPEVPVAFTRRRWRGGGAKWLHPTFPVALRQRDNMVFYRNESQPPDPGSMGIDRFVHRCTD